VGFSIFFVWGQVHRPIRDLMRGTRRLAAGVLGYRLQVRSRDELGALAESFNQMAGQLEQAHADLTEWARTLEDRVTEKTAALEKANRTLLTSEKMASLGRLAATVAHEVNNPLFGMLTYARLVRKELDKQDLDETGRERMRGHLEVIERESQRCGDLMRNLLQFARQSPPQMSEIRMEQVLGRALELVRHKCALAETALEVDAEPDLPAVYGDPAQLQQVLLVLLVNASEALVKGGEIRVTVHAERKRKRLVVSVRDNGPGIPEEIQSQIFEPFFGTKDNQHRTGLGLAIARGIVERHGGVISVASKPGEGAEFVVELPLERPGAPPVEGKAEQA
jgi:two-component system NtrC family sensor kinase